MCAVAAYLGCPHEEDVLNMSNLFFDGILDFIGRRLKYEAMANYAGNSYMKDAYKIIEDNYPLKAISKAEESSGVGALFKGIKIMKVKDDQQGSLMAELNQNRENAKALKEKENG